MSNQQKAIDNLSSIQSQLDELASESKLEEQSYIEMCNSLKAVFDHVNCSSANRLYDDLVQWRTINNELKAKVHQLQSTIKIIKKNENRNEQYNRCVHILSSGKYSGMQCMKPCTGEKCSQHNK